MNNEKPQQTNQPKPFYWKIPDCCRLGLPSCPHVLKKQKKTKRNVGL